MYQRNTHNFQCSAYCSLSSIDCVGIYFFRLRCICIFRNIKFRIEHGLFYCTMIQLQRLKSHNTPSYTSTESIVQILRILDIKSIFHKFVITKKILYDRVKIVLANHCCFCCVFQEFRGQSHSHSNANK